MKVAVTGGTGFVGSHAVEALLAAGHDVRLLVRDPARLAPALDPLEVDAPEDLVTGDVTDPAAIEALLEGCDAVVHSASVYSLDTRDAARIRATNVDGTRLVIESARRLGLDPIVHISSVAALIPAQEPLTATSPTSDGGGIYGQSKAESELVARAHQAEAAPVVSVMPAGVWGPHDPHFGESARIASDFLRGQTRTLPRHASLSIVDVRDVAAVIAGTIETGQGPRSYLAAPHHVPLSELFRRLGELCGRNIRFVNLPNATISASVAPLGPLQRILPFRLPIPAEGVRMSMSWPPGDSSPAAEEFDIRWRPLEETLADTVTAMVQHGQLSAKHAGTLAE